MFLVTRVLTAVQAEVLAPYVQVLLLVPGLLYVASAPFLAVYRGAEVQSKSKVQYVPVFQCLERLLKGILCYVVLYLRQSPLSSGLAEDSIVTTYDKRHLLSLTEAASGKPCPRLTGV